jgi:hypothetical protein
MVQAGFTQCFDLAGSASHEVREISDDGGGDRISIVTVVLDEEEPIRTHGQLFANSDFLEELTDRFELSCRDRFSFRQLAEKLP